MGLELWLGDQLVLEIFRDDSQKSRQVTLYQKDVFLTLLQEAIAKFKQEIPWEFWTDGDVLSAWDIDKAKELLAEYKARKKR